MLLADQWKEFSAMVMHSEAPLVQRIEMRRAFYAGAAEVTRMVLKMAEQEEPDAIHAMNSLVDEIDHFAQAVQNGEA